MKITVHVKAVEEIEAARAAVEAQMQDGDDGEIIVAQPVNAAVERQERRPAGGVPAGMRE